MSSSVAGRVCARCAKIKQRCDGGSPCARCSRLGHICEVQQPGKKADLPKSLGHRRPRASRSRGGCLSCKARKKKCDEIRPRCSDCRRLNLPCRWKSSSPSSPGSAASAPSHTCTSSPLSETSNSLTLTSVTDPTTPSDQTGLEDPIGSLSAWLTPEAIAAPVASPGGSSNPYLHNEEDRSLFNHYLHIVARALSRSGDPDSNPFLVTLLPMAAASDTITSVILGLSGCHWKRVYPTIWNRALTRQGRALAQVNQLLSLPNPEATLEACATVLLLCLTELFDGTSRVWKWHLKAAGALLSSVGVGSLEATSEGRFCLHLFHYLDSMSTISRCKPPLLHDGDSLTDLTAGSPPPRSLPTVPGDAICGMAPALLDFLGMVNLLAAHRSRRVDELSEIGFRAAAAHVQSQIDTWRAEYESGCTSAVPDRDGDKATTAFEWAIRLRLHQIVNGYDPCHAAVETAITTILAAVLAIPYGSPVEGSLLFPLVIAGASSTSMERRMMVKERLMVMENTLGFGHIPHARELLETVWAESTEWNWARVRYSHFPGMVFI
ncbi:fungal-specific transcription factor domain-containing protein [Aspergillus ambiguus]|uniref:Zn(II)2Cys6 transcription factor n=1 Tax=Aspergillus ambiguus TaxID=176160 RepID=UPI003CCCC3ED